MTIRIHPTALVSADAEIGEDVEIGAFAMVGPECVRVPPMMNVPGPDLTMESLPVPVPPERSRMILLSKMEMLVTTLLRTNRASALTDSASAFWISEIVPVRMPMLPTVSVLPINCSLPLVPPPPEAKESADESGICSERPI